MARFQGLKFEVRSSKQTRIGKLEFSRERTQRSAEKAKNGGKKIRIADLRFEISKWALRAEKSVAARNC
jgi:hypothetical protein